MASSIKPTPPSGSGFGKEPYDRPVFRAEAAAAKASVDTFSPPNPGQSNPPSNADRPQSRQ